MQQQGDLLLLTESIAAFFKGAVQGWIKFNSEFDKGGNINTLIKTGCSPLVRQTNCSNKGKLGGLRGGKQQSGNQLLQNFNAQKMYKKNNTKQFMRLLNAKD
jgi:hypothetical protein